MTPRPATTLLAGLLAIPTDSQGREMELKRSSTEGNGYQRYAEAWRVRLWAASTPKRPYRTTYSEAIVLAGPTASAIGVHAISSSSTSAAPAPSTAATSAPQHLVLLLQLPVHLLQFLRLSANISNGSLCLLSKDRSRLGCFKDSKRGCRNGMHVHEESELLTEASLL